MNEMRVIVALPGATRLLTRVSAELFEDATPGAIVEVETPNGGQLALVSQHPHVLDRLSIVAATARDELINSHGSNLPHHL